MQTLTEAELDLVRRVVGDLKRRYTQELTHLKALEERANAITGLDMAVGGNTPSLDQAQQGMLREILGKFPHDRVAEIVRKLQ